MLTLHYFTHTDINCRMHNIIPGALIQQSELYKQLRVRNETKGKAKNGTCMLRTKQQVHKADAAHGRVSARRAAKGHTRSHR